MKACSEINIAFIPYEEKVLLFLLFYGKRILFFILA
jgi:hypothetical protein